jgi:hypothetical protein
LIKEENLIGGEIKVNPKVPSRMTVTLLVECHSLAANQSFTKELKLMRRRANGKN